MLKRRFIFTAKMILVCWALTLVGQNASANMLIIFLPSKRTYRIIKSLPDRRLTDHEARDLTSNVVGRLNELAIEIRRHDDVAERGYNNELAVGAYRGVDHEAREEARDRAQELRGEAQSLLSLLVYRLATVQGVRAAETAEVLKWTKLVLRDTRLRNVLLFNFLFLNFFWWSLSIASPIIGLKISAMMLLLLYLPPSTVADLYRFVAHHKATSLPTDPIQILDNTTMTSEQFAAAIERFIGTGLDMGIFRLTADDVLPAGYEHHEAARNFCNRLLSNPLTESPNLTHVRINAEPGPPHQEPQTTNEALQYAEPAPSPRRRAY